MTRWTLYSLRLITQPVLFFLLQILTTGMLMFAKILINEQNLDFCDTTVNLLNSSTFTSFYVKKRSEVNERYKQYVEIGRLELILGSGVPLMS